MSFINNCMAAVGTKHEHGKQLAEVLIDADYRGHFSHGLNRLEMYANDIAAKSTVSDKEPKILSEKAASAYMDCENLLGPVVGNFSMQLAITKTKKAGIGWVTAKGGYKGYGLAMLVEIFTGILGNADYGPKIRSWKTGKTTANLGQCFVAIDPDAFTTGFKSRMQHMSDLLREREPVDPDLPVLVAGDPEMKHMAYFAHLRGIPYHPNLISLMEKLAERSSVKPMKTKSFQAWCVKSGAGVNLHMARTGRFVTWSSFWNSQSQTEPV